MYMFKFGRSFTYFKDTILRGNRSRCGCDVTHTYPYTYLRGFAFMPGNFSQDLPKSKLILSLYLSTLNLIYLFFPHNFMKMRIHVSRTHIRPTGWVIPYYLWGFLPSWRDHISNKPPLFFRQLMHWKLLLCRNGVGVDEASLMYWYGAITNRHEALHKLLCALCS